MRPRESWRRSRRLLQLRHQRPIDISERKTRRRQLTWQNGPNAGDVCEVQDAVDVGVSRRRDASNPHQSMALRRRDRRVDHFAVGEIVECLRAPLAAEIATRDDTGDRGVDRCVLVAAGHPDVLCRVAAHRPRHQETAHVAAPCGRLTQRVIERGLLHRFRGQLGDNREVGGLECERIRVDIGVGEAQFYRRRSRHEFRRRPAMIRWLASRSM